MLPKLKVLSVGEKKFPPRPEGWNAKETVRKCGGGGGPYNFHIPQIIIKFLEVIPHLESLTIHKFAHPNQLWSRGTRNESTATIDRKLFDEITEVSKNLKELRCIKVQFIGPTGKKSSRILHRSYLLSKGVKFIPLKYNGDTDDEYSSEDIEDEKETGDSSSENDDSSIDNDD